MATRITPNYDSYASSKSHLAAPPGSQYPSSPSFVPLNTLPRDRGRPYNPQDPPFNPARTRSPSPTPSEIEAMKKPLIDWKKVLNWRTYAQVRYIPYYIALIICLVLVALMTLYHEEIVGWLAPAARWMHDFKYGWLIPIAVLFVISFPPLFGHEIVGVLCGLVWGLWWGFAIFSAGTLLGEIGNYYAFKYCCASRGEKLERTKASYACLARVVREGGFKVALAARLSAIPGHFTTAVFSTCGMGIFVFTLACILSLPKQFIVVYLGVILEQSDDTPEEKAAEEKNSKIISNVVLAITFLITVASGWWIWREMEKVKPAVFRDRRIAKKRALAVSGFDRAPIEVREVHNAREAEEADSELGHTPLRENEGWLGKGGYGYTPGFNPQTQGGEFTPDTRGHPYSNHYQAPSDYTEVSTPQSSFYGHQRLTTAPPQIPELDVPTARRVGRDGFKVSGREPTEGTVGMGSWGGILREGSEASVEHSAHITHRTVHPPDQAENYVAPAGLSNRPYNPPPPQQQPHQKSQQDHFSESLPKEASPVNLNRLSAFNDNTGTIIRPGHVQDQRKSVEWKPAGNHRVGRSFRASVEGPPDELSYSHRDRRSTAEEGEFQSFHTARDREGSTTTFGGRSMHSRETATDGASDDDRDYPHPPGRF